MARVPFLAEDAAQHVDAHHRAAILDVGDGKVSPQAGDDIEDHRCFCPPAGLHQTGTALEFLIGAKDDHAEEVLRPRRQFMVALVPAGR